MLILPKASHHFARWFITHNLVQAVWIWNLLSIITFVMMSVVITQPVLPYPGIGDLDLLIDSHGGGKASLTVSLWRSRLKLLRGYCLQLGNFNISLYFFEWKLPLLVFSI